MSSNLTQRIKNLPWVSAKTASDGSSILAVATQLVVETAIAPQFELLLEQKLNTRPVKLTTLLDGLNKDKGAPDMTIYEAVPGAGSEFRPFADKAAIFSLADAVRKELYQEYGFSPRTVSPNHILVPAPAGDECPHGPPHPVGNRRPLGDPGPDRVEVAVIDSGWQWDDGQWGASPLDPYVTHYAAERLPTVAESQANGGHWEAGTPDIPGEVDPASKRLLALAGHANFIAGVIADHCPEARITVLNHNGSYLENPNRGSAAAKGKKAKAQAQADPGSWDFPTEAAVARSLCSLLSAAREERVPMPRVIDVGFAFLPDDAGTGNPNDDVSVLWDHTFRYIGQDVVVVSPAGNQGSTLRRYPAALWTIGKLFENVYGVGSIDDPANPGPTRSRDFTNLGTGSDRWVRCAAVGSNVVSTFLPLKAALEEGEDDTEWDFTNGWAMWNGTSFATPKIVAALASRLTNPGMTSGQAWDDLKNADPSRVQDDLGWHFPELG